MPADEVPASPTSTRAPASDRGRPPMVVAVATDEGFAMATAVAVRSLLDTAAPDREIELVLLGVDLSEDTWARLLASCDRPGLKTRRIDSDPERFASLPETGDITRTTYQRLLLPDLLPTYDRVLYLDGDVLVRADVASLFDTDLQGMPTAAVQEFLEWYVSSGKWGGIPGWQQLGLDPVAPCINAGVLLISLDAWRQERVAERSMEYLERCQRIRHHDQDALNVVLSGRVLLLDPRWNAQIWMAEAQWPPTPAPGDPPTPFSWATVRRIRRDPWIVHFNTEAKPWKAESRHPFQKEWLSVLARTAWADDRPPVASTARRLLRRVRWLGRAARHRATSP